MRHVLIDHVRERQAERRGGDLQRVTMDGLDHVTTGACSRST
ncbi:MAG: hypothetical protein IPK97_20920 [Ahniella sp.]|nr:hypothetical protein [Ahniella sp.]